MQLQSAILLSVLSLGAHIHAEQHQPQYPLRNWLSKISSYIPSTAWRNPSEVWHDSKAATAAAVAAMRIVPLTLENWKSTLVVDAPAASLDDEPRVQEWWVLVTGGNRTCYGQCARVEQAWNESAVLFTSVPGKAPHQAILDCDNAHVLCSIWSAAPPSLWHILVPSSSAPAVRTEIYISPLNASTVTAAQLVGLHQSGSWREQEPYRGAFHPFDGWLARSKLNIPVGYVMSWFATAPTWAMMLVVSLASRRFMGRRQQGQPARREQVSAGRQARPS